jgi:Polyketide cyclase / dehydrase and lipid transport
MLAGMWETTLRVTCEQNVDADPERVWALLAVPAALTAMPGRRFAFPVQGVIPGTDRLCCLIVAGREHARCAVLDVREEDPGQLISWQTRSTRPAGKQTLTLSARPRPGGCELSVAVTDVVPRLSKASKQRYWRHAARAWADNLRAVAENRAPWPPAGLPADVREACAIRPLPGKTEQASGAALINADPDAVWETVWAPETARLIDPDTVAGAGHVPGSPQRAPGEMRYRVMREPDDRFTARVDVAREVTEGRAVTQRLGSPRMEVRQRVRPADGGTQLELTTRWEASLFTKATAAAAAEDIARQMQGQADRYKAVIEKA